jgi:glucose/arabinose dehydrogenase
VLLNGRRLPGWSDYFPIRKYAMHSSNRRILLYRQAFLAGTLLLAAQQVLAQDLLNDNPTYSPFNLELRQIVQMPAGQHNIISMTTRLGDPRLYVATQQGSIFAVNQNPTGLGTLSLFFNATNTAAGGVSMTNGNQTFVTQGGLQSFAFHPDFDHLGTPGYGKVFATMVRAHSDSADFLGNSPHGPSADSVLAEWTYDHETGTFSNFRELFRVNLPKEDHMIKQARFNPYSKPGDEDYGLLYLTHGDSNSQESLPGNYPQLLSNALGKMLRIDPLDPDGAGGQRYSIPAANPFAASSDPTVLKEIYAYGFRNPHTFSFNQDDEGNVRILIGDIGRANVEEVNLAVAGGNFGWPLREGTFVHLQNPDNAPNDGYIDGVAALPAGEANLGYSYPVAQYDHNAATGAINTGDSIASGFVIRNGSDPNLENHFIFNNFPDHNGFVYHTDLGEMLGAVTELDPDDPARDEPSELTQAVLHKLRLALDHDQNPSTPAIVYDDYSALISGLPASTTDRNDARYGEGVFGEMYMSTKKSGGRIYLVTNSVPLSGDFNHDRVVDAADYTVWRDSLDSTGYHLAADANGDAKVDGADYDVWKSHFGESWGAAGSGAGTFAVPEPAAAALVLFGCVVLSVIRGGRRFTH